MVMVTMIILMCFLSDPLRHYDYDEDGISNYDENDDDGDGVLDVNDNNLDADPVINFYDPFSS